MEYTLEIPEASIESSVGGWRLSLTFLTEVKHFQQKHYPIGGRWDEEQIEAMVLALIRVAAVGGKSVATGGVPIRGC